MLGFHNKITVTIVSRTTVVTVAETTAIAMATSTVPSTGRRRITCRTAVYFATIIIKKNINGPTTTSVAVTLLNSQAIAAKGKLV